MLSHFIRHFLFSAAIAATLIYTSNHLYADQTDTPTSYTAEAERVSYDADNSVSWQRMPDSIARLHLVQDGQKKQLDLQLAYRESLDHLQYKDKDHLLATVSAYRDPARPVTISLKSESITSNRPSHEELKLSPVKDSARPILTVQKTPFTTLTLTSDNPDLRLVSMTGGSAGGMVMDDSRLIVTRGNKVTLYNITNPTRPVETASFLFHGLVSKPQIFGDLLAVIIDTKQLTVLDIKPTSLEPVFLLGLPYEATDLTTGNQVLFIGGERGVILIDLKNTGSPQALEIPLEPTLVKNVVCSGNLLGVLDGYFGLRLFDISSPHDPKLLKTVSPSAEILSPPVFHGNKLLILTRQGEVTLTPDSHREPVFRQTAWSERGSHLYAHRAINDRFYARWNDTIVSITPSENSTWTSRSLAPVKDNSVKPTQIAADGKLIAVDKADEITIYQDTGDASPSIESFSLQSTLPVLDEVNVLAPTPGGIAACGGSSLRLLTIDNDSIQFHGFCETNHATAAVTSGSMVILGTYSRGIQSVDITQKESPALLCKGNTGSNFYCNRLKVLNDIVLASTTSGIKGFSPEDCFTKPQMELRPKSNYTFAFPATKGLLYQTDGSTLHIVENTNGTYKTTGNPIRLPVWAFDVDGKDTLFYVAGGSNFFVLDALNPYKPQVRGRLELKCEHLTVSGRLACAFGEQNPGVHIIDVANADAPAKLATGLPGMQVRDVAILGSRIAVACGDHGLAIMEYNLSPELAGIPPEQWQFQAAADKALTGDMAGLDELESLTKQGWALKLDFDEKRDLMLELAIPVFTRMGKEVAEGNTTATHILLEAMKRLEINTYAGSGIAKAAELGNDQMLQYLIDYEKHGMLQSSAVGHMIQPAKRGNQRAIEFLADVTRENSNKALWYMTMVGLEEAVRAGNTTAIEAAERIARDDHAQTKAMAIKALNDAKTAGHKPAAAILDQLSKKSQ